MDNTQCSSTPLASEVMITAVMLIFWLRAPAFGPLERWDVVDLFAGQARIARLARQYGQSSIAMDIGYHEDPHIFDINSEPGFVYLSLGNFKIISYLLSLVPYLVLHDYFIGSP